MKYVIIGNGVASIGAIEGIRMHDREGEIIVLSEEDKATYGRPLISYYLAGKVKAEDMALRPPEFYERNKISVRLGSTVASIDPAAQTLTTTDGETIAYDRLLLATGGVPGAAHIPGRDAEGVYSFTTWADADRLREITPTARRFVVIGAGLIALKAAEGLLLLGKDVTLVVRSRIMRAYFDEAAGSLIRRHLESKGMKFHQAAPEAVALDRSGRAVAVRTADAELPADCVIMATGVSPRMELAQAAGIECGKGVLCDDRMRTSVKNVFAAGDVAEALDMQSGRRAVTPIWPSAYNQGINAGINMAGANMPYPGGLSMNSITFFGLGTISVGLSNPPEEEVADGTYEVTVDADPQAMTYRKLVFARDRLVGCILIGHVDRAGIYTSFIQNRLPVTADVRRELLAGTASPLYWPDDVYAEKMIRREDAIRI